MIGPCRILIVGEAWGAQEEILRRPFVGEAGKELFLMLGEAIPAVMPELHSEIVSQFRYGLAWTRKRDEWLREAQIGLTNVLAFRPPSNDLEQLCISKKELPKDYLIPYMPKRLISFSKGKYLAPEYFPELQRLRQEILDFAPNLILALGNTACWALLQRTDISKIRGTTVLSHFGPKVLPTYHPAAVLRKWDWRPIVVADIAKAWIESGTRELRRPERQILISPGLQEISSWRETTLHARVISCDTETYGGQIRCIGFAASPESAIVIPFLDPAKPGWSSWDTAEEEWRAWTIVKEILESPTPKLFQNGLYDLQYICKMGIRPQACVEDTMLLHHSLFPELRKSLGFLGSVYTNEPAWKLMRTAKPDTEKREE